MLSAKQGELIEFLSHAVVAAANRNITAISMIFICTILHQLCLWNMDPIDGHALLAAEYLKAAERPNPICEFQGYITALSGG